MTTINIKSVHGEFEPLKGLLSDGIREERRKIEYALNLMYRNFNVEILHSALLRSE